MMPHPGPSVLKSSSNGMTDVVKHPFLKETTIPRKPSLILKRTLLRPAYDETVIKAVKLFSSKNLKNNIFKGFCLKLDLIFENSFSCVY